MRDAVTPEVRSCPTQRSSRADRTGPLFPWVGIRILRKLYSRTNLGPPRTPKVSRVSGHPKKGSQFTCTFGGCPEILLVKVNTLRLGHTGSGSLHVKWFEGLLSPVFGGGGRT